MLRMLDSVFTCGNRVRCNALVLDFWMMRRRPNVQRLRVALLVGMAVGVLLWLALFRAVQ